MSDFSSTIKNLPKGMREIRVELAAPVFETCFQKALRRLSQNLELEGFRKGKVPPNIAEKYIGQDALLEEAGHIAIHQSYPEVVDHHRLEPIGKPEITLTKIARGNPLSYTARVTVLEDAVLPKDWKSTRVTRKAVIVEDRELEEALAYLQKSRAQYIAVARPAAKGDFAEIDFTIRHGGVILENGSATKHPLIIGEGKLAPGFEEQLIGMGVGEDKTFVLTFPADYAQKTYAGKIVDCTAKLVNLCERRLPLLDDAFAKSIGDFKNFDGLQENVKGGILREKEEHESSRAQMEIVTRIAEKARMEIPDILIDREIEKMFQDLAERLTSFGLALDEYLAHLQKTKEDLARDWRSEAEKRVRIALTLRAIAKAESIVPTDEEISAHIQDMVKNLPTAKEVKKQYSQKALSEYARGALTNKKVLQFLGENCVTS